MIKEGNSGYLGNCRCAEPHPRHGEKRDSANSAFALEMLKTAGGGGNEINIHNAGVTEPFVQSHGHQ